MFSRYFFPRMGGVEKHVEEVSKRLVSQGFKVDLVTEKYKGDLRDKEKINNINIVRLYYPKVKFLGLIIIWIKLLRYKKLIKSSDIIHIHDVFIWYLPFRFLYPKKRVFVTFHGWEGKYPIPRINILQRKIANLLTSGSICVGSYIEKYYGVKANLISYGGVNFNNKRLKKKQKYCVYVGRLEEDTGLPILLTVFEKLKSYEIHFCGDGRLRKKCEKIGEVHGFCDPRIYLEKSEICFSSGYLAILEAFSCRNLVVVAYQNKLKRDYYLNSPFKKYLTYGSRPTEILKKLRNVEKDKSKKIKVIDKAYGFSRNQSWSKVVTDYKMLWEFKSPEI